jgi:hypothetical protein
LAQHTNDSWAYLFNIEELWQDLLLPLEIVLKGTNVEGLVDLAIIPNTRRHGDSRKALGVVAARIDLWMFNGEGKTRCQTRNCGDTFRERENEQRS